MIPASQDPSRPDSVSGPGLCPGPGGSEAAGDGTPARHCDPGRAESVIMIPRRSLSDESAPVTPDVISVLGPGT